MRRGRQLEHVDRRSVDAQLEALRLVEHRNFVEARAGVTRQLDPNAVDAVPRKCVPQRRAAPRAERQPFEHGRSAAAQAERGTSRWSAARGDAPTATELIFCAAARYRSISVGDILCTPAMLSNP